MQLNSFSVDCTLAGSDVALDIAKMPQLAQRKSGKVSFLIYNQGVAAAYLETAGDVAAAVLSSVVIAAGATVMVGPYEWPDAVPYLHSLMGANCKVTPFWEE